ncbi:hypothetical protein GQ457_10G004520 [Hibiscus cannabinus]
MAEMAEEVEKIRKEMKKEIEDLLDKSQTDLLAKIEVMLSGRDPERGKGVVIKSDAMINELGNAQDGMQSANEPAYQASPSSKLVVHEGPNECTVPDLNEIEKLKVEIPKQFEDLYKQLEDKVKNVDPFPRMDARELSLVPDLELPPKFKMPDFEKYNGTSCPEAHITMFVRRMTGYINNDPLLIHCFQDSLTGSAAKWYNQLSRAKINSWNDLAQAFVKQYNHVTDITPDRVTLQNMEKKSNESFRQYAQRWRDVAAQVQPPLLEKETTMLFVGTLKKPFLSHMIGSATKDFSDIVMTGEMIENAIRSGKIEAEESSRSASFSKQVTVGQPKATPQNAQTSSNQKANPRAKRENVQYTPIPVTYGELYKNLYDAHVVSPFYLTPLQPPYPQWYDPKVQCDYHAGITGHSIENCTAFKNLVEKLIKIGVVRFDDAVGPNVAGNPLPNHAEAGVNAIIDNGSKKVKASVDDIKSPLNWVWKKMFEMGLVTSHLQDGQNTPDGYCLYHNEHGHDIQECVDFKELIQSMMDNKQMEFYEETTPEEMDVYASEEETPKKDVERNFPVVIISGPKKGERVESSRPRVVIQRPVPFPYKDDKAVPWRYDCDMAIQGNNFSGEGLNDVGFFTRSGRRYVPKEGESDNVKVKEEEVREFLKFLKHSEYSVVEQLHKLPARISVLALLLSSESHRNALLKVLNETFVPKDISVNKLDKLAKNINADNFIYFNDEEIPPNGRGTAKALHITTRCKGYTLPGVLIDNGSALNVLPLSTLNRLPVDSSHMKTCHNLVRAFDGTERSVMGRMEIQLQIGPTLYDVDFLVMDIKPTYNCLLGRPWIHSAGAVPSSLHQKLKYISDGRLITVSAEEDIIASISSDAPYVGVDEDAVECSFRSLEFVNATFIAEGSRIPVPKLSKTTRMGIKLTVGKGARVGRGLGKYLQGRVNAPVLASKQDRFGLGYKPDAKQRRAEMAKRQERRKARLSGKDMKWEPMTFPPLSKTFVSGGFENPKSAQEVEDWEKMLEILDISAIMDENEGNNMSGICPYVPGTVLDNWIAEDLPAVFKNISE